MQGIGWSHGRRSRSPRSRESTWWRCPRRRLGPPPRTSPARTLASHRATRIGRHLATSAEPFLVDRRVAAINVALAIQVSRAASLRSDARLLLVGYAFLIAAGFLLLHALATPGVIVAGANVGSRWRRRSAWRSHRSSSRLRRWSSPRLCRHESSPSTRSFGRRSWVSWWLGGSSRSQSCRHWRTPWRRGPPVRSAGWRSSRSGSICSPQRASFELTDASHR